MGGMGFRDLALFNDSFVGKTSLEVAEKHKLSLLQGIQSTFFLKLLNHGGKGFKIGLLCLVEHFTRKGCASEWIEVAYWKWKLCQNLAELLVAKKTPTVSVITFNPFNEGCHSRHVDRGRKKTMEPWDD